MLVFGVAMMGRRRREKGGETYDLRKRRIALVVGVIIVSRVE